MKKLSKIIFGVCFMAITLGVIHVFMNPPAALAQSYIGQLIWTKMCPGHVVLGYPYPDNGIPDSEQAVECYMIQPSYTPTKTPTLTSSPTIIYPRTPTRTPTITLTATDTPTSSPLPTFTLTPQPPRPTDTPTPTPTPTITPTLTLVPTSTPTLTPTYSPTFTPTPTPVVSGWINVDYAAQYLFDSIPADYVTAARGLHLSFADASVGSNVNDGLNCLASSSWSTSSGSCRVAYIDQTLTTFRTYSLRDVIIPQEIQFNPGYPRPNWTYFTNNGGWQDMVKAFINAVPTYYAQGYRVMGFQMSYVNVLPGSSLDDKFFTRGFNGWNIEDLEAMELQYPDVTFVYFTTSLARDVGSVDSYNFNNQMRLYAASRQVPLYDMASIESHDPTGKECLYNGYPVICRNYTTEYQGGHLGSISDGSLRTARAWWVMMAQIAGWRP